MKLEAVIFDLDGVLTDTVPLHYRAWKKLFSGEGVRFNLEIYKKLVDGVPRLDGIKNVLPEREKSELEELAERKQGYYLEELEENPPAVFGDALFMLEDLRKNNIKIGVASSSKNCRAILRKLKIPGIDAVVSGADIEKGKPEPEIFLKAAGLLGVAPENCLVVEDAILGVKAAKAAGMKCIMVCRHGEAPGFAGYDLKVENLKITRDEIVKKIFPIGSWQNFSVDSQRNIC